MASDWRGAAARGAADARPDHLSAQPYLKRQDPETGDIIRESHLMPSSTWTDSTIGKICKRVFDEDADGNLKEPVWVEIGRPLIPESLELTAQEAVVRVRDHTRLYLHQV